MLQEIVWLWWHRNVRDQKGERDRLPNQMQNKLSRAQKLKNERIMLDGKVLFTTLSLPRLLILLMTTLMPELWPSLACHSGGAGFNKACVLWTLRDRCKLCGCCCVPRACHHSAVLFLNSSVPQSNKLMLLTHRLTLFDVESIGLLKSKSISPSINWVLCL